jgi:hypothetical protein
MVDRAEGEIGPDGRQPGGDTTQVHGNHPDWRLEAGGRHSLPPLETSPQGLLRSQPTRHQTWLSVRRHLGPLSAAGQLIVWSHCVMADGAPRADGSDPGSPWSSGGSAGVPPAPTSPNSEKWPAAHNIACRLPAKSRGADSPRPIDVDREPVGPSFKSLVLAETWLAHRCPRLPLPSFRFESLALDCSAVRIDRADRLPLQTHRR